MGMAEESPYGGLAHLCGEESRRGWRVRAAGRKEEVISMHRALRWWWRWEKR
jgi:hypothetical protein